jgi:hypothetical protein
MAASLEELERRIDELRVAVRQASMAGDRAAARELRKQLRAAGRDWDAALERLAPPAGGASAPVGDSAPGEGSQAREMRGEDGAVAMEGAATRERAAAGDARLLPVREQVHQALTLLGVPSGQRLVLTVHEAFLGAAPSAARLTSLRRDEERSFRSAPYARPYYLCAALTYDLLAPARGVLAVSTWPMDRRVIGPLSPRVNYLTAAIRVAEATLRVPAPTPAALRLLWRFAANIPGAAGISRAANPELVMEAAGAELDVHREADQAHRNAAADRARTQLDDAEQLFGSRLRAFPGAATG